MLTAQREEREQLKHLLKLVFKTADNQKKGPVHRAGSRHHRDKAVAKMDGVDNAHDDVKDISLWKLWGKSSDYEPVENITLTLEAENYSDKIDAAVEAFYTSDKPIEERTIAFTTHIVEIFNYNDAGVISEDEKTALENAVKAAYADLSMLEMLAEAHSNVNNGLWNRKKPWRSEDMSDFDLSNLTDKQAEILKILGLDTDEKQAHAQMMLKLFHGYLKSHEDQNDNAFYTTMERGINNFDFMRTRYKKNQFLGIAIIASFSALVSLSILLLKLFNFDISALPSLINFCVVGSTSYTDEFSDISFKFSKLVESGRAFDDWKIKNSNEELLLSKLKHHEIFENNMQYDDDFPEELKGVGEHELLFLFNLFQAQGNISAHMRVPLDIEIKRANKLFVNSDSKIYKFSQLYQSQKNDRRNLTLDKFNKKQSASDYNDIYEFISNADNKKKIAEHFNKEINDIMDQDGIDYLKFKYDERKDLSDRLWRREVKFAQATLSFSGVVGSVTAAILIGVGITPPGAAIIALIAITFAASGLAIWYQNKRNAEKGAANKEKYFEKLSQLFGDSSACTKEKITNYEKYKPTSIIDVSVLGAEDRCNPLGLVIN